MIEVLSGNLSPHPLPAGRRLSPHKGEEKDEGMENENA
jgi:hypothetical protein